MEKRAVISEEDTPNLDKPRGERTHAVVIDENSKIPPYQQKIAKILGSTPVLLEDLDENHPTRRLIAGLPAGMRPRSR